MQLGRMRIDVALLTAALMAVSACGGGGHDGPRPTPSTTPGGTPTPTASATPVATPTPIASPGPFPIAVGIEPGFGVAAGWGGDRYLVTFGDTTDRAAPDVVGVRLAQDGQVIDSAPFLLSDFGSEPFLSPDARYSPGGIAFADGAFGAFLFGAGTVMDGIPGQVVGFVAVPAEGAPALPATALDEQASFSMVQTSLRSPIAVTTNGARYLGVYQRILTMVGSFSLSQVFGQIVTLSEAGVVTQPVGPLTGIVPPTDGVVTDGSTPGVAISATLTLVAWVGIDIDVKSPSDMSTSLQGVFLTPDEATFVRLSDTAAGSQNVAVASDGTDFLVVWTATTAAQPGTLSELRAIRVDSSGSAEPAGGFLIAGGDSRKSLGGIAFAGGVYLVAWIEDGVLRGARLGTDGEEAEVFSIDPGPVSGVALATDGARFLTVFERTDSESSADVLGSFVAIE